MTRETDLQDPNLISSDRRFDRYMGSKQFFKIFREFMVREGLSSSPELVGLEAAISAQERLLRSKTAGFFSPTIAVRAEAGRIFSKTGAGSESAPNPGELPFTLPEVDDTNWSIGLNLSFPLFTGGAKFVERQKASLELQQLRFERDAIAERIEQRVRSTLHKAGASLAGIRQAREAAEAANKSLDVVRDAYSRGVVSIIDLLDAQNAALVSNLATANSAYDFLVDLMAVEGAVGKFYFFRAAEDREDFFNRVDDYFAKQGFSMEN